VRRAPGKLVSLPRSKMPWARVLSLIGLLNKFDKPQARELKSNDMGGDRIGGMIGGDA
jgi:hypothetical protein